MIVALFRTDASASKRPVTYDIPAAVAQRRTVTLQILWPLAGSRFRALICFGRLGSFRVRSGASEFGQSLCQCCSVRDQSYLVQIAAPAGRRLRACREPRRHLAAATHRSQQIAQPSNPSGISASAEVTDPENLRGERTGDGTLPDGLGVVPTRAAVPRVGARLKSI